MTRITTSLLLLSFALLPSTSRAGLQTVPHVDIARYLGDWYQISHIPKWYEGFENCKCARQRLTATKDPSVITVFNSCTRDSGKLGSVSGTASNDDPKSNSKYTVRFKGIPFPGTYWIIGLDTDYRYAVVSNQGGDALYILSKTPTLDPALYKEAFDLAARQVDVSAVKMTSQTKCIYPN